MDKTAFITICTDDKYLPGVIALSRSLKQTATSHPLYVLTTTNGMSTNGNNTLRSEGISVLTASAIVPSRYIHELNVRNGSPNWDNTFFKLRIFGLTQFDTLVYLDSDMIVLNNIDHLFDKPHMSAVAAGHHFNPSWIQLNSGLMVITPDKSLESRLLALITEKPDDSMLNYSGIGDQDLINHYFKDWPEQANLHLPETYNQFISLIPEYLRKGYLGSLDDIHVVHFVGKTKPWNYTVKDYWRALARAVRWQSLGEFKTISTFKRLLHS